MPKTDNGPRRPMTLDEIRACDAVTLSPIQASGALKCSPYTLNVSARNGTLGIRHMFCGRNLRIFRADLLDACGVKGDA